MKKALFLTAICAALTACGGGSGGSNGGSDPAPSPTPTPTPTNVSCTLPSDALTTYKGPTIFGSAGTWTVTAGSNNSLNIASTLGTSSFSVSPTSNGCTYTNTVGSNKVAATFNENGIIATTAIINGVSQPALAVANPVSAVNSTTFGQIQGAYLMTSYEQNGGTPHSFYRKLTVDSISGNTISGTIQWMVNGSWTLKHNIQLIANSQTGALNVLVEDDLNPGIFTPEGISAYFKPVGSETILVLGVNNFNPNNSNYGIWVGTNNPVTSLASGIYVDNGIDGSSINQSSTDSWISVTSNTIGGGTNTYTISPNVPTTNFFGLADPGQTVPTVGVASALGIMGLADQYGPEPSERTGSSAVFTFIVRPKQTQQ